MLAKTLDSIAVSKGLPVIRFAHQTSVNQLRSIANSTLEGNCVVYSRISIYLSLEREASEVPLTLYNMVSNTPCLPVKLKMKETLNSGAPKLHRVLPSEFYDEFTLGGVVPVLDWFIDQSNSLAAPPKWDAALINDYRQRFSPEKIKASCQGPETYPGAALLLVNAFEDNSFVNQRIAVVGSETPWIESILVNMNNVVTTVEYNLPDCDDGAFEFCTYWDFESDVDMLPFDSIVSFSSTEHSGLGRYGDPLDPWGDVKAMAAIRRRLKIGGTLIWGGPVGPDAVVWNAHRIYGPLRLPILFHRFAEIGWYGPDKNSLFSASAPRLNSSQPAVVLRRLPD